MFTFIFNSQFSNLNELKVLLADGISFIITSLLLIPNAIAVH